MRDGSAPTDEEEYVVASATSGAAREKEGSETGDSPTRESGDYSETNTKVLRKSEGKLERGRISRAQLEQEMRFQARAPGGSE